VFHTFDFIVDKISSLYVIVLGIHRSHEACVVINAFIFSQFFKDILFFSKKLIKAQFFSNILIYSESLFLSLLLLNEFIDFSLYFCDKCSFSPFIRFLKIVSVQLFTSLSVSHLSLCGSTSLAHTQT
jgi:hypothetical protein